MKIASIETFRGLAPEDFQHALNTRNNKATLMNIEVGKMIVVADEIRPAKGTLKSYIRKAYGIELEPAAYKVAKAFSGFVGDGHGKITEAQFDALEQNWMFTVSAIVGLLAGIPEMEAADIREQVAVLLRAPDKKTGEALKVIKDSLKPEPEQGGGGSGDGESPENIVPMPLDGIELIKVLKRELMTCEDSAMLKTLRKGIRALHTVAIGRIRIVEAAEAERTATASQAAA